MLESMFSDEDVERDGLRKLGKEAVKEVSNEYLICEVIVGSGGKQEFRH